MKVRLKPDTTHEGPAKAGHYVLRRAIAVGTDPDHRIVTAGDSVVIVELEERIDVTVNRRAIRLAEALQSAALPGIRDIVPTYRSVAIYFDPLRTDAERLSRTVEAEIDEPPAAPASTPIRIPVCYGGAYGPDLDDVAVFAGLSPSAVIELHSSPTYHVFMMGFLPGFAYMGTVDERIAAPRRAAPRVRVRAGSVGIAGGQTGVYPTDSPGGWQLIGMTPARPFDLRRAEPFLFAAGDAVRFYPIEAGELEHAGVA
jgi:KipI family sensor histidine kinase inhibitor